MTQNNSEQIIQKLGTLEQIQDDTDYDASSDQEPTTGHHEHASRPYMVTSLELTADKPQKLFEKNYQQLCLDMFFVEVIGESILNEETYEKLQNVVAEYFLILRQDMQKAILTFQKKIEDEDDNTILAGQTAPKVFEAEINTPGVRKFITALKMLDNLIQLIDTMWLLDLIDQKRRKDQSFQWRNRLNNICGRIRKWSENVRRARKELYARYNQDVPKHPDEKDSPQDFFAMEITKVTTPKKQNTEEEPQSKAATA